jgi:hypothetical protein
MQRGHATLFNLGAKKALWPCAASRGLDGSPRGQEIHDMLQASFRQLNSEFGFALTLTRLPSLERCDR